MLSQRERRVLSDIEEALRADAPELDRRLQDFSAWARTRRLVLAVVVVTGP